MVNKRTATPAIPGVIQAGAIYTLREAAARLNFGQKTIRAAQRDGLRTTLYGRTKYVLGADILDWFGDLAEQQHAGNGEVEA